MEDRNRSIGPVVALGALAGALAGALIVLGFVMWGKMYLEQGSTQEALSQRDLDKAISELVEEESATIHVVERVAPAVASIALRRNLSDVRRGVFLFEEEEVEDELVDVGAGTAFFVTTEGLLLTNRHVVDTDDVQIFVITQEGDEHEAEVVARDTLYDVAVLRVISEVPEGGFPVVELDPEDDIQIGQTVIAIGNALSEFSNTVTKGIVSGKDRRLIAGGNAGTELIQEAIQTDAAINPGNSGGPLINLLGQVVGINTAVSSRGNDLGFAIPISVGRKVIEDVEEYGRIVRPWIGIRYRMLTNANAEALGFAKLQRGAYILPEEDSGAPGVLSDSPASDAGLKEGDVIVKLDGELLGEEDNLATVLNRYRPGDTIELEVLREGDTIGTHVVTLGEFDQSVLE